MNELTKLTLERIGLILDSEDADFAALETARMLADLFGVFTSRVCSDLPRGPFDRDMIIRCIVRKAEETLLSIITLVDAKQSYYGMPLVRPLCEEFLLACFLCELDQETADKIIVEKTKLDICNGIRAQDSFFPEAARCFGVDDFQAPPRSASDKEGLSDEIKRCRKVLREIGSQVGWGKRDFPTVSFMAAKTNNKYVYDFFYHASSSSVHASFHHLGRMVWGDDKYSVNNQNFAQYYGRFSLIYGAWLSCLTMSLGSNYFSDSWPNHIEESFSILFAFCVIPPIMQMGPKIVTQYELRWGKENDQDFRVV